MSKIDAKIVPSLMTKAQKKAMHDYTNQLGEIIWLYNAVHAELLRIFSAAIDKQNGDLGKTMILSLKTDSAQRDVIKAFFEEKFKDKTIGRSLVWLSEKVGELSGFRNSLVHSPMMIMNFKDGPYAVPNTLAIKKKQELKILEYRIERKLVLYKNDVTRLLKYAISIRSRINQGVLSRALLPKKQKAWPKRPLLRTLQKTSPKGKKKSNPHTSSI